MDGLEATQKIREFKKDLPIIGVTAYAMTGDREKVLNAGCNDYIAKPIESDKLIKLIKKHLEIL
jgi:CheY-like chemotaxis protein